MDLEDDRKRATSEELEATRERQHDLLVQIDRCQSLLDRSRDWARFDAAPFREALSCSLELLGAPPLEESTDEDGRPVWTFPALDQRAATDPSWAATLDTLRVPRKTDQKLVDWRRVAPIRPVIFEDSGVLSEDTVHLHLEQRVAQRLLARFRAQGFIPPRSITGVSRADEGFHPARGAARSPFALRSSCGATARGAGAGRRSMDRARAPSRTAQGIRAGGGGANACIARRVTGRWWSGTQRGRAAQAARRRDARHRRAVASSRTHGRRNPAARRNRELCASAANGRRSSCSRRWSGNVVG